MTDLGKMLVIAGILLAAVGALLWSGAGGWGGCRGISSIRRATLRFISPF
jgi:hypothetical protein